MMIKLCQIIYLIGVGGLKINAIDDDGVNLELKAEEEKTNAEGDLSSDDSLKDVKITINPCAAEYQIEPEEDFVESTSPSPQRAFADMTIEPGPLARVLEKTMIDYNPENPSRESLRAGASRVLFAIVRFLWRHGVDGDQHEIEDPKKYAHLPVTERFDFSDLERDPKDSGKVSLEIELGFRGSQDEPEFYIIVRHMDPASPGTLRKTIPTQLLEGAEVELHDIEGFRKKWTLFLEAMQKEHDEQTGSEAGIDMDSCRIWDVSGDQFFLRLWSPFDCQICMNRLLPEPMIQGKIAPIPQRLTMLDCYLHKCSGSLFHDDCLLQFIRSQRRTGHGFFCPSCRLDCEDTAMNILRTRNPSSPVRLETAIQQAVTPPVPAVIRQESIMRRAEIIRQQAAIRRAENEEGEEEFEIAGFHPLAKCAIWFLVPSTMIMMIYLIIMSATNSW